TNSTRDWSSDVCSSDLRHLRAVLGHNLVASRARRSRRGSHRLGNHDLLRQSRLDRASRRRHIDRRPLEVESHKKQLEEKLGAYAQWSGGREPREIAESLWLNFAWRTKVKNLADAVVRRRGRVVDI